MALALNIGRSGGKSARADLFRRRKGRCADPRTADIRHDFLKILHNWPQIQEVRNSALSPQVSGDFAEFRTTCRGPMNLAPSPHRPPEGGSANRRHFSGFSEDILDMRPMAREVRNPSLSLQVCGDRAEYRPIRRGGPRIALFRRRTARGRIREPPECFRTFRSFYKTGRRSRKYEIPPYRPK